MPDLRKLIKYEETLAANAKEDDPISILYKRNTVSSRAKLGDKAKEKEQQVLQTLGEKSSSKQNMEAGDQASGKLTSQPDSVFTKSSRKESVTDFATAFCNQLCLDDEKSRGDGDKARPQYKLGMQREVSSDESCPSSQRSKWSSRSSFPRCRPLSAAKVHSKPKKTFKQSDPVALYHYYQNEWAHFREQIPGDTSHSNVRQEIRKKLIDPK